MDPADFASLLEREPLEEMEVPPAQQFRVAFWDAVNDYARACGGDTSNVTVSGIRMGAVSALERLVMPDGFSPTREGWVERVGAQMCRAEKAERERDLAKKTCESQAARISSLEGVLREIRWKVNDMSRLMPGEDVQELDAITSLIRETLDPHTPWCRDENHQGPCESRDEGYSDD